MAVIIINSSNQAEHVKVRLPNGKTDTVTVHPGRSNLAEGWSVVDTGVSVRHLRVLGTPVDEAVAEVAAKQSAPAAEDKPADKE